MNRPDFEAALSSIQRLMAIDPAAAQAELGKLIVDCPDDSTVRRRLALALHGWGRDGEAIEVMSSVVERGPTAPALNDLGSLYFHYGDLPEAVAQYQRALQIDPRYALGWANLADAQSELGILAGAIASYRRALECSPGNEGALIGLATALSRHGDQAAAIEICHHAVQTFPASARAWHTLAIALERSGDLVKAIECERRALTIEPAFAAGWHALGNLLDDAGNVREAADAYRRALEIAPEITAAAFDLAALGEAPAPGIMPRNYATRLFDDFAATFDRRLVAELSYHAPQALRQLMNDCLTSLQPEADKFDILDLGCGTGLVGREFHGLAASLVGVDLSAGMLAQAEQTGVYNELATGDAVEFMLSTNRQFDLALAADLFIYIGDLTPIFHAAAKVLRQDGWFAFSIETIDVAPYVLRRTRRYAHSLPYLRDLAGASGFRWIAARETPIREGPDGAVPGHVVALQRTAAE